MSQNNRRSTEDLLQAGDAKNFIPRLHTELERIAKFRLREQGARGTLDTKALVSEAYLNLGDKPKSFNDRKHFLATASLIMRSIVVNYAEKRRAQKRGGGAEHTEYIDSYINSGILNLNQEAAEILDFDKALIELAEISKRKSQVVELRFFGGLTIDETAEALDISTATVKREWAAARTLLEEIIHKYQQ